MFPSILTASYCKGCFTVHPHGIDTDIVGYCGAFSPSLKCNDEEQSDGFTLGLITAAHSLRHGPYFVPP